jgi:hypothetical protein
MNTEETNPKEIPQLTEEQEKRLLFLFPLFLKNIEDLHKTRQFIIDRAYKFIGFSNFIVALFITGLKSPEPVVLVFVLSCFITAVFFKGIIDTSHVLKQGLDSKHILDLYKDKNRTYISQESWAFQEQANKSNFYGYIIQETQNQHENLVNGNKALVNSYKKALTSSVIGFILVILTYLQVKYQLITFLLAFVPVAK